MEELITKAQSDPASVTTHELLVFEKYVSTYICSHEDASSYLGALIDAYGADVCDPIGRPEKSRNVIESTNRLTTMVQSAIQSLPVLLSYRSVILQMVAAFLDALPLYESRDRAHGSPKSLCDPKELNPLLTADEYVLLVLFYMDIGDLESEVLFLPFMDGVSALHRRCMPLVFPICSASAGSTQISMISNLHDESIESLAQELKSLREKVAQMLSIGGDKAAACSSSDESWVAVGGGRGWVLEAQERLTESVKGNSDHQGNAHQRISRKSLTNAMARRVLFFFGEVGKELVYGLHNLESRSADCNDSAVFESEMAAQLLETANEVSSIVLSPFSLHPACLANHGMATVTGVEDVHSPIIASASTSIVSMSIQSAEAILSLSAVELKSSREPMQDSETAAPQDHAAQSALHLITMLLSHLQKYLLNYQKRLEHSSFDSHAISGTARRRLGGLLSSSGLDGASAYAIDPLRHTSVKRSLCRLFHRSLQHRALQSIYGALQTALDAFGGSGDDAVLESQRVFPTMAISLESPISQAQIDEKKADLARECCAVIPFYSSSDAESFDMRPFGGVGARGTGIVKTGSETAVAKGDFGADFDYEDEDEDGEGDFANENAVGGDKGRKGQRTPLIHSSAGPVSVDALVEMVMLSLRHLDIKGDNISTLHLRGLAQMQYTAAKKAQKDEVERARRIEAQGVESISANKLIFHTKHGSAMETKGAKAVESSAPRAMLQKAAFLSAFRSYAFVKGEVEGVVRHTQALISRCLVQLPPMVSDSAMDALLERVKFEVDQEVALNALLKSRAQEEEVICRAHGGPHTAAALDSLSSLPPLVFQGKPVTRDAPKLTAGPSSFYQLGLQVLFTYYALQAPVEEASSMSLLSSGHVLMMMGQNDGLSFQGQGSLFGGATISGGSHVDGAAMQFVADTSISTDDPISWLLEAADDGAGDDGFGMGGSGQSGGGSSPHGGSAFARRKRKRGINDDTFSRSRVSANSNLPAATDESTSSYFFQDSMQTPSPYSHFLCRFIEVLDEAGHQGLLLDLLLQCPAITIYVWNYVHQYFCMSQDKMRCMLGMLVLTTIATKRAVYRTHAINSLLYFSGVQREYPRRLAIVQIGKIFSTSLSSQNQSSLDAKCDGIINDEAVKQLVNYAKRQVVSIPMYSTSLNTPAKHRQGKLKRRRETQSGSAYSYNEAPGGSESDDDRDDEDGFDGNAREGEVSAFHDSANGKELSSAQIQEYEKDLRKLGDVLDRLLGLFLKLCALQPKDLVPLLLKVYRDCGNRGNFAMQQLMANHIDVLSLFGHLFQQDPLHFLTVVMPHLRRHSVHAAPLVQRILWGISRDLREMGSKERQKLRSSDAAGQLGETGNPGGRGAGAAGGAVLDAIIGTSSSLLAGVEKLRQVASVLLGHVKAMYESSSIPIERNAHAGGEDAREEHMLHDVRFVAPFFSLIPSKELRETYLLPLLAFINLQHTRNSQQNPRSAHDLRQGGAHGSGGAETGGALSSTDILRSMFTKSHSFALTEPETNFLLRAVIKEALVRTTIPFSDNVVRGISPVDLLVEIHQAPVLSLRREARGVVGDAGKRVATSGPPSGLANPVILESVGASNVSSILPTKGILDDDGEHNPHSTPGLSVGAAGHGVSQSAADSLARAQRVPPVTISCCKYVIQICLEITRTFDSNTSVRLYGLDEMSRTLRRLIQLKPIPTQTMLTVIQVSNNMFSGTMEGVSMYDAKTFVQFVVDTILEPLKRDSMWDVDEQLWKGALIFSDKYYTACSQFLTSLPENVLILALRKSKTLQDQFRLEHGTNASFNHILSALD